MNIYDALTLTSDPPHDILSIMFDMSGRWGGTWGKETAIGTHCL